MEDKQINDKEARFCPYCDEEIAEEPIPTCGACEVTIFYCPSCRKPTPRDKKVCSHCGAQIKG